VKTFKLEFDEFKSMHITSNTIIIKINNILLITLLLLMNKVKYMITIFHTEL